MMQDSSHQDEVDPQQLLLQSMLLPKEEQLVMTADDEMLRQVAAQQFQRTQKQQQLLMVDSLGQLHHYVAPENIPELEAIHASAPATAAVYVSSVLVIYVLGLIIIFMHHMNTAYGPWIWTLADACDELRPLWSWSQKREDHTTASPRRGNMATSVHGNKNKKKKKKKARFANEFDEEELQDEEIITPRTASCPQHASAIVQLQDFGNGNVDVITSVSDPGPGGLRPGSKRNSFMQRLQNGYTKFRPNQDGSNFGPNCNGNADRRMNKDQTDDSSFMDHSNRMNGCSGFSSIASHDQSPPTGVIIEK